jgi:type IV pilus assembly protein PilY1
MNFKTLVGAVLAAVAVTFTSHSLAQSASASNVSEDFTGTSTSLSWFYFNGACLTAGTTAASVTPAAPPGSIPSCLQVLASYYSTNKTTNGIGDNDTYLVGGASGYLGGSSQPTVSTQQADPSGSGALRFTNGKPFGHQERGAIVSNYTFPTDQGVQITFKSVTYYGDGNSTGPDGADGMSFYLIDGCMPIAGGTVPSDCFNTNKDGTTSTTESNPVYATGITFPGIGATGGSLAYTCSNETGNTNDGLVGGYLGLGIDEYGNFLNGTSNTLNEKNTTINSGDNTASGGGFLAGRIGIRGAGSIAWAALNAAYPTCSSATAAVPCYPSALSAADRKKAVIGTCSSGNLGNYTNASSPVSAGAASLSNTANTAGILDYMAIPGAYSPVSGFRIADETATTRSNAEPILYNLKITQDGLLSLSYSYNGGSVVKVITNQQITTSNGALPSSFRFGFAGSTGGSTNVHEILCFKAVPAETSGSSGAINVFQNPTIKTGTQIFLANYYPSDWTGQLEAIPLVYTSATNTLSAGTPNWDASCVLTGGACSSTAAPSGTAEDPTTRVMLTWSGTAGIPFEWNSLSQTQKNTLDAGDATPYSDNRLKFIRGDRTNEITTKGVGTFRARDSVLSDIVDSSPSWIGPPQTYSSLATWVDQLYPLVTQQETATGAQTYGQFTANQYTGSPTKESRMNVVYVGANDGFIHGFRAGTLDQFGNLASTNNDGQEVLAYMPSVVFNNIHPVDSGGNVVTSLDFANTQYAHAWYVDAPPSTGDLFYGNAWHTWVVGGLGPGGAGIYALDVTDPTQFSESNAASLVIGDWSTSNLTCASDTSSTKCVNNLGNTYGQPQIRRFHNGQWGFVFGNGLGSTNGTAGIFIGLVSASSSSSKPTVTFYYLATGNTTTGNGIANASPADLDLDHFVDYIYAGDLLGNVWKFDVTSNDPTKWAVTTSSPLFSAGSSQPITTKITVSTLKTITTVSNASGLAISNGPERVILNFGTGRQIPQTLTVAAQYQTTSQYLYGIWDWDMGSGSVAGSWNKISPNQQGIGLTGSAKPTTTTTTANLRSQTLTEHLVTATGTTSTGYATLTTNTVCWNGSSTCSSGNNQMGWYTLLPGTSEQIIYDPFISNIDGTLNVNTYIPSTSTVLSCSQNGPWGFSLIMDASTGAGLSLFNTGTGSNKADGLQNNASGTSSVVIAPNGTPFLVSHTSSGNVVGNQINDYSIVTGTRMYWIQKR